MYHTVPVVLFAWFRWLEAGFERMLVEVLNCGGDVDTTGAIAGAMAGASFGVSAIPKEWREGIADWPLSRALLHDYVDCLNEDREAPGIFPLFSFFRNLLFLIIVLGHGLLRLVPCSVRKFR